MLNTWYLLDQVKLSIWPGGLIFSLFSPTCKSETSKEPVFFCPPTWQETTNIFFSSSTTTITHKVQLSSWAPTWGGTTPLPQYPAVVPSTAPVACRILLDWRDPRKGAWMAKEKLVGNRKPWGCPVHSLWSLHSHALEPAYCRCESREEYQKMNNKNSQLFPTPSVKETTEMTFGKGSAHIPPCKGTAFTMTGQVMRNRDTYNRCHFCPIEAPEPAWKGESTHKLSQELQSHGKAPQKHLLLLQTTTTAATWESGWGNIPCNPMPYIPKGMQTVLINLA